jgi:hypothetical protein
LSRGKGKVLAAKSESAAKPTGKRVAVVCDWTKCSRGIFWPEILREIDPTLRVDKYPLAQRVDPGNPVGAEDGFFISEYDIVIVNWDAANGDPDFGADFAQRWFDHSRRAILMWVEKGNLLIVEGQARLHAPCEAAYDALLGPSELLVSRPAHELALQMDLERRMGRLCRVPRRAQRSRFFRDLATLETQRARKHFELFPGPAGLAVTADIEERWTTLYRGWFRWNPLRRTTFAWVPVAKAVRRGVDPPTLLAARVGKEGAIFVSTMFLASTEQTRLVKALIATHGQGSDLPTRPRPFKVLGDSAVQLSAAVGAGALAGGAGSSVVVDSGVLKVLFALAGAAVVALLIRAPRAYRWLKHEILSL